MRIFMTRGGGLGIHVSITFLQFTGGGVWDILSKGGRQNDIFRV